MELAFWGQPESETWDALVNSADHGILYHTWKWLKNIEEHGGGDLKAIVGLKGGEPQVVLPVFIQKKAGMRLVFSPPQRMATTYLGPLFTNYSKLKQSRRESVYIDFQESVESYLSEEVRPDYSFISTSPGLIDVRPWHWSGYDSKPLYQYRFDITKGTEALWSGLKRSLRNEIKQTQKAGVTVREGGLSDYLGLIEDTKGRYMEQGMRVTESDAYLKELFKLFHPENMRVLVAEHEGERVAGIVQLLYRDTEISWIGGVKSELPRINPNALVHWEGLRKAAENGKKTYIEIGANTRHLCRNKRKFNPTPQQYFNLRRYSSTRIRLMESAYFNVAKPLMSAVRSRI